MGLLGSFKRMMAGSKVDIRARFELLREAVSGTMSSFYMARDKENDRIVGLKLLDLKKTAEFEGRFKGLKKPTEGEVTAAISHPRIVKLYEHGITTRDEQYLVLEFVEGQGMNSILVAKSPLLDGRRVALLRHAAEALAAVHKAEFLHRDICPRNFIVAPDGESLKLIDFGLSVPFTPPFMQPGNRTGNPNYMAPELVKRMSTDQRIDVFALGVTAYELCTFEMPWSRGLKGDVAMAHANKPPAPITKYRPQINDKLAKAISSCLEQDRAKRCATAEQFLRSIQGIGHEDEP